MRPVALDVAGSSAAARVSDQIAGEITARAEVWSRNGRTELHIRLEPPELGTVRVHFVASDHSVTARLVASDETARQLIESQLHTLRESLAHVGVALERFDVASDAGGSRRQWDWRQAEPVPVLPAFRGRSASHPPNVTGSSRTAHRIDCLA